VKSEKLKVKNEKWLKGRMVERLKGGMKIVKPTTDN
jgi:hypothetical protein